MKKRLIGLIIALIMTTVVVSGCIGSDEEPTKPVVPATALSLEKTSDTLSEYQTSYTVKGKTEPNATVKVSSSKLNLDDIELHVSDDGSFEYQLNIPQDVDSVSITFKASSEGNKSDSSVSLSLSRNKPVENKPDSSSSDDSSSSNSDSSSSSSSGTFEDGFMDGAADAKAGRPAKYSGDPIMYGDPYQAGYADGYRNPHLV
ncbi:MAG: hypothetical protein FWH54_06615 [Methanobrevibacter sp.]|nr:hypothetical protein [Methanobrevibacter sp.]